MVESRKAVEKFIDYIDWDKSPNGWGDGKLKKDAPESAKKAYADYKKTHADDTADKREQAKQARFEQEKAFLKKAESKQTPKKK